MYVCMYVCMYQAYFKRQLKAVSDIQNRKSQLEEEVIHLQEDLDKAKVDSEQRSLVRYSP